MSNDLKISEENMTHYLASFLKTGCGYLKEKHFLQEIWSTTVLSEAIDDMIKKLVLCKKCQSTKLEIYVNTSGLQGNCPSVMRCTILTVHRGISSILQNHVQKVD